MTDTPTRSRLAAELRTVADKSRPAKAAVYRALADRAETGEFDDFATTHVCGLTALHQELMAAGLLKFAARVALGEFDASQAESDAWANSPEGRDAMGLPYSEQLAALFGPFND